MNRFTMIIFTALALILTGSACQSSQGNNSDTRAVVKEISHYSPAVGRRMHFNIILPRGYDKSDQTYPVLYLLHGLTANYHQWKELAVPEYAERFHMIVVLPDGGNSWYVNWAESAGGQQNNWEDYIIQDLIGYIDANYRTIADRRGRAIGGLSMGGYGALTLGLKHPALFASVGSHSGALKYAADQRKNLENNEPVWVVWQNALKDDSSRAFGIAVEGFASQRERTPRGKPFVTPADADASDPFKLLPLVPPDQLPHIYLDCGVDDRRLGASQEFMGLLMRQNIPFTYGQAGGAHNSAYWEREVLISMAVQYAVLLRNLWE